MGFSTDMIYYLLVQNSYHILVISRELRNLKTKTKPDARRTLVCCYKIKMFKKVKVGASENSKQQ